MARISVLILNGSECLFFLEKNWFCNFYILTEDCKYFKFIFKIWLKCLKSQCN